MKNLSDYTKQKDYLICVDSDGCAMDTMDIKHFCCFGPCMVTEWNLEQWREDILTRWNEINLYTMTRGINRFKGLALALSEINQQYCRIEAIDDLTEWAENSKELSNDALMQAIAARPDSIALQKALSWSVAVNKSINELPEEQKLPFEKAKEALEYAHTKADVAIVSSANLDAVLEEWEKYGLLPHTDIVLAQNAGSKAFCIAELLKKGYEPEKVLMCGDAPGDLQAAEKNGVFYYPILVRSEKESWEEFISTACDKLIAGTYGGEYQHKKKEQFLENLGGKNNQRRLRPMIDLKAKPYCLSDEDIAWVTKTIEEMTDEEKVGQLFFQLTAGMDESYLQELMEKYHLGGCRYNNMPGAAVQMQNTILQKYAKVPVFIACNTETGGNGACSDGTYIGSGIKIGATGNNEYAHNLGKYSNEEAAAIGCNMAFAPVCDIHYNWENTEVVARAFGNDPARVAEMSKAYLEGAHTIPGFACAAKHFPGNGQDFRDAHIANNINSFNEQEWMESYGMVYKTLFDAGLEAVMGGHIMMPAYMREIKPDIKDEEMMPATLCPEIMTGLLRDKLGFNGMVVTDASHMVAMTDRMTRKEMLPASINAGCDMFLFFNDPDEDFATMLEAYQTGKISEERMTEALTRILGLKAHMGLHKKAKEELVPGQEALQAIGKEEYKAASEAISKDCITLVKYKDENVLPLTPEKYKRIMIVYVKGAAGAMDALVQMAMGGGGAKKNPAEELRDRLIEKGFDAFIYESPIDKMKAQIAAGEKPSLNLYFAGKNAIKDFVSEQDLVITLCDVANGRPSFGLSKGGGEIPWYVFELPVVAVSVNAPTMLADIPQVRTYINAYDSKPSTMDALVENLVTGPEAFKGKDPIDSFCGLWDARI